MLCVVSVIDGICALSFFTCLNYNCDMHFIDAFVKRMLCVVYKLLSTLLKLGAPNDACCCRN